MMIKAPEISFRNVEHSDAVESAIRDRLDRLDRICPKIIGCTVTVDAPHRHQKNGRIYTVDIDLSVPGHEIVVNRDPQRDHSHEDLYVAIRDAFQAAERQIHKTFARMRGDVKHHEPPPHGTVANLFPDDGYGFIEADDGTRVYFHKNAVAEGDFNDIEVGSMVEFVAANGDKGPQASTVKPTTLWKLG